MQSDEFTQTILEFGNTKIPFVKHVYNVDTLMLPHSVRCKSLSGVRRWITSRICNLKFTYGKYQINWPNGNVISF